MKKLKLESLQFSPPEILSRMQLKHVMGGDDGGSGSGSGSGSGGTGDCTGECPGYSGNATTSHSCDPCGLDITKSEFDPESCCF